MYNAKRGNGVMIATDTGATENRCKQQITDMNTVF